MAFEHVFFKHMFGYLIFLTNASFISIAHFIYFFIQTQATGKHSKISLSMEVLLFKLYFLLFAVIQRNFFCNLLKFLLSSLITTLCYIRCTGRGFRNIQTVHQIIIKPNQLFRVKFMDEYTDSLVTMFVLQDQDEMKKVFAIE